MVLSDSVSMVLPGSFTFDNFKRRVENLGFQVFSSADIAANALTSPENTQQSKVESGREGSFGGIFRSEVQVGAEAGGRATS